MLKLSREKDVYDHLELDDYNDFLLKRENSVDLVTAADVLVYVGDLAKTFSSASKALVKGGLFAASFEVLNETDCSESCRGWHLEKSGRFAHSSQYLISMAFQNNLAVNVSKEFQPRFE
eukprot:CAMPEP_0171453016 /NCGR_PEP_ID=MMETSP0945-20130129/894_1 /TAXON_ID=109269 /ORGANISM="Vaucheria litorea, Strain CCMP2940" /LENGTH=118 /DNA_ID=CAMNT_0011977801 /DNA_START=130 /DNA_END=483 /DNA_ORIENTATION=-